MIQCASTIVFHLSKKKFWVLIFFIVVLLLHFGELAICAQVNKMNNQKVESITRAASIPALKAEFEKLGFSFRHQALKCSGRDFLWFTLDEGSGNYLIHAFLYELHGESPRLVLHILPEPNRVAIEPKAEKQRVDILEKRKQTPTNTSVIAQYYLRD